MRFPFAPPPLSCLIRQREVREGRRKEEEGDQRERESGAVQHGMAVGRGSPTALDSVSSFPFPFFLPCTLSLHLSRSAESLLFPPPPTPFCLMLLHRWFKKLANCLVSNSQTIQAKGHYSHLLFSYASGPRPYYLYARLPALSSLHASVMLSPTHPLFLPGGPSTIAAPARGEPYTPTSM